MDKVRKGYKMTELGEIPAEWKVEKLYEIGEILMGQSPLGDSYNSCGDGLPLLNGPTEFTNKSPIPKQWTTKPTKICKNNDILFCVRGSSTGRMNISNDKYCIGRGLAAIRGKEGVSVTAFIYYYLQTSIERILNLSAGSTFPNVSRDDLSDIPCILPCLREQQKIADVLSTVDKHIEKTESLIEEIKELKKGLMQRLLTKGIVHTKFKKTDVGEIPVEWEVKKLEQLFSINNNSINPYEYDEKFLHYSIPAYDDLGKPLYQWGSEIKSSKFVIDKDSILVSKLNPRIKRVWKVEYIKDVRQVCSTEFINFVPTHKEVNKDFYYQYFLSDIFQYELLIREKGTTGSRKRVSPCDTNNILIVLPPLQEQKKIADCLMSIDLTIGQYSSKMNKMNELKHVLMQKLLTGKIRVKV